jgi:hypothetical protein
MGDMTTIYLSDSDFIGYAATRYWLALGAKRVDLNRDTVTKIADFDVGTGDWIISAKATLRAGSPDQTTLQLRLTCIEGTRNSEDRALASVSQLGYATLSLMLGAHVLTRGNIQIEATLQGDRRVELTHVVVTAIKTDRLIVGLL